MASFTSTTTPPSIAREKTDSSFVQWWSLLWVLLAALTSNTPVLSPTEDLLREWGSFGAEWSDRISQQDQVPNSSPVWDWVQCGMLNLLGHRWDTVISLSTWPTTQRQQGNFIMNNQTMASCCRQHSTASTPASSARHLAQRSSFCVWVLDTAC